MRATHGRRDPGRRQVAESPCPAKLRVLSQARKASSPQSISSLGQTPIALWEVRRPSTPTIVVPHRAGRDGGLNPSLDVPNGVTHSRLGPVRHHEFLAYIPQMRTHRAARALN